MPLTSFSLRLNFRVKKRLEMLARRTGRSRSSLAAEAIEEYVGANEWQIAGVRRAMGQLDRGEGIAHEKVKDWFKESSRFALRKRGSSPTGTKRQL